jgi:antitoxin Phd
LSGGAASAAGSIFFAYGALRRGVNLKIEVGDACLHNNALQVALLFRRPNVTTTFVQRKKMRKIQLKDAKANLSSVVNEAVNGEPAIITRHGKPEAVVLGFKQWKRLAKVPTFGQLLMSAPLETGDLPRRNRSPVRRVKILRLILRFMYLVDTNVIWAGAKSRERRRITQVDGRTLDQALSVGSYCG